MMIATETMTDLEIIEAATQLLIRELGPVGYARFIQQFSQGTGDYTEDRHTWLDRLTAEDIARDLQEATDLLQDMGLTVEPLPQSPAVAATDTTAQGVPA